MIDTHAHLNFKVFDKDCAQVIERSFNNGIKKIINVGAQMETSKKTIEIANQFENVYATVGLHPIHVGDEKFNYEIYKKLAQNKKVVAIGETGLDYFHITDAKLILLQKEIFLDHIKLAQELDLPLILHCRGSKPPHLLWTKAHGFKNFQSVQNRCGGKNDPDKPYLEMLQILSDNKAKKGVIHCFSGNVKIAEQFLEQGFYIGFTGIITFAKTMEDVVKKIVLDKILTETDCPYLAPAPYRGQRSEPWHIKFVIEKIAEIKKLSYNKVEKQTVENAVKFFKFT